jgi:hypothetical protein
MADRKMKTVDTSKWAIEGAGDDWIVIDTSMPNSEEYNYGQIAHGFGSYDEAAQFIAEYNTPQAIAERQASWAAARAIGRLKAIAAGDDPFRRSS